MKRQLGYIVTGVLSFAIVLTSCTHNSEHDQQQTVFGNIPSALADSLKLIGQNIQQHTIDPTKDNVIKGHDGTSIYIGANSLVDESGEPVTSEVIISLREHYTISDFVTGNLQATHNNEILQSQGMIYFSAKRANGGSVTIDKSKPVRIEFPVNEKIQETKIFTGARDENGNLNWNEVREPSKLLVPFPIHFISQGSPFTECPGSFGITLDTIKNSYFNYYGSVSQFENTFLATREFKQRYDTACWKVVLKIYIDNINRNLWEADELVVKHFIKDSIERVSYEINYRPPGINGGPRTKEQVYAHEWLVKSAKESAHRLIAAFQKFASERLTRIDPAKTFADTTIAQMRKAFVAYDALEFGWVNVDYFYKDPKAVDIKLAVKTNEPAPIINLIVPKRNIILSGIDNQGNTYFFTKRKDGYNKLPRGEKALIIAINIADNRLRYAEKEIVIGQSENEILELKTIKGEELRIRLKGLNSSSLAN
jgi:hypothetical protein